MIVFARKWDDLCFLGISRGASWSVLEAPLAVWRPSWASWNDLSATRGFLDRLGGLLGPSWLVVGLSWLAVRDMWVDTAAEDGQVQSLEHERVDLRSVPAFNMRAVLGSINATSHAQCPT